MIPVPFAYQSYTHPSLDVSAQRLLNCYVEQQPRGAKSTVTLHGFPGLDVFATVGDGPIRGFFFQNGIVYVVSKTELYSLTSAGVTLLLGTGILGLGIVSMAGNSEQIAIVNGTQGFIYDETSGVFAEISDPQFHAANTVTSLDSYFLFDRKNTNEFFVSDLLDGTSYSALMVASAESKPDRILAVRNVSGLLRLFGETSIEAWASIGAGTPPFQRMDGATISTRGLLAPLAIVEEDESSFMLGNDRVFYRLAGAQLQRISNHAIEAAWATYETVSDAFCFSVAFGGHKFVYLTFPTEGKTWGFDIATQMPHERISWDPSGAEAKWRGNCAVEAFGKTLIGDANSGRVCVFSPTVHTEFGDPIRLVMTAPPIFDPQGRHLFCSKLELDIETGVGLTTGQGSDPQIMLDWSDDGGHTFTTPQLWRSMGKKGEYGRTLMWDRLGRFKSRVFRLQISDPVRRCVISARAALDVSQD